MSFSSSQQEASELATQFVLTPVQFPPELLIWAVTGAGKTEIIFEAVFQALQLGRNVLIVTPRKDVVLELTPRFQAVFPEQPIVALYGESTQKGETSSLVIATTHQALNLYRYFDLVIVDEVDAFPFHNNPMLHFAVNQAITKNGQMIYLTATPPPHLLQRVHQGKALSVCIPCRHHGYPLVIPKYLIDTRLSKQVRQTKLPQSIRDFILHVVKSNRQGLVFVPSIDWIDRLVHLIHLDSIANQSNLKPRNPQLERDHTITDLIVDNHFPWVEGVHSKDPLRSEKVIAFREGAIRVLVTTTILERGVTIPSIDCLVCKADATIFDESSLIQIAGRVGRSSDDPSGMVLFVAEAKTEAMVRAINHIKEMNRLAQKKGYLKNRELTQNSYDAFWQRFIEYLKG